MGPHGCPGSPGDVALHPAAPPLSAACKGTSRVAVPGRHPVSWPGTWGLSRFAGFFHAYESAWPLARRRAEVASPASPEGRGQGVAEHPRTPAPPSHRGHRPPGRGSPGCRPQHPHGPEPREPACRPARGCRVDGRGGQPGGRDGTGAATSQDSRTDSVLAFRLRVGKSTSSRAWAAPHRHPVLVAPQVLGRARSRVRAGASLGTPSTPGTPCTPVPHAPRAPYAPQYPTYPMHPMHSGHPMRPGTPCAPCTTGTPCTPHPALPFWVASSSVSSWRAGLTQPLRGRGPVSRWEQLSHPKNPDTPPQQKDTNFGGSPITCSGSKTSGGTLGGPLSLLGHLTL